MSNNEQPHEMDTTRSARSTTAFRIDAFSTALRLLVAMTVLSGCGEGTREVHTSGDTMALVTGTKDEIHATGRDTSATTEEPMVEEIPMTPAAMKESGIEIEAITRQPVTGIVTAPGQVVPTQAGEAHVGTLVPGRITRLLVAEGSFVSSGTPLAELEAFNIGEMKGEYRNARIQVEQTGMVLARQRTLATEGIGARRTFEEAQAAASQARASLRIAEAKLRAAGINPASIGKEGAFTSRILLRSPISGIVAHRFVAVGEYLETNRDAFEVVNVATIWIDAQVSPDVASGLRAGGVGFIRDGDQHRHSGRIVFIAPTVNPETRTVTVRTELSNPDGHLRPQEFVKAEFERSVSGFALAVPREAVEQDGSDYYVYRTEEPNVFQRIMVQPGAMTGDRIIVTEGLTEGDRVAVSGLFYLKSIHRKGELAGEE